MEIVKLAQIPVIHVPEAHLSAHLVKQMQDSPQPTLVNAALALFLIVSETVLISHATSHALHAQEFLQTNVRHADLWQA